MKKTVNDGTGLYDGVQKNIMENRTECICFGHERRERIHVDGLFSS